MSRRFGSPGPMTRNMAALFKKRRYESRSDEEIAAEMDNRGLYYRLGWPDLPPLPVTTRREGALQAVKNGAHVLERVREFLVPHQLSALDSFFAYRLPCDAETKTDIDVYHTLVITIHRSTPASFRRAITMIRKYFKTLPSTRDTSIEVIDFRALYGLCTLPIRYSETAIHDTWSSACDIAISEIAERGERWLSIEAAHRGLQADQCRLTIVITTPTASSNVWSHGIMPSMRIRLDQLPVSYAVEVLYGTNLLGATADERTAHINRASYAEELCMGAGIGIAYDEKHAGTMGGRLLLSDGSSYGLTNHHVVRDDRIDALLESPHGPLYPGNESLARQPHHLNSPSNRDHNSFLEKLDKDRAVWEAASSRSDAEGSQYLHYLQETENTRMVAQNHSRIFGTLFAASGTRLVTRPEFLPSPPMTQRASNRRVIPEYNFFLDWALLKIDPQRTVANKMPDSRYHFGGVDTQIRSGLVCDTWAPLNIGKTRIKSVEVDVAKFGSTTGSTFGTLNTALTLINPEENSAWSTISAPYGLSDKKYAVCYSIYRRGRRDFVDLGDSGSIVMHDPTGTWLGLLFGRNVNDEGLMIPLDVVFNDIQKVTGLSVIKPTLRPVHDSA